MRLQEVHGVDELMKKKNENKIPLSEYWESLNTSIKVFFIISFVLFVAELICSELFSKTFSLAIYSISYNLSFYFVYCLAFPLLFLVLYFLLLFKRLINKKSIAVIYVLLFTYPWFLYIVALALLDFIINLSGGFG